tara:strand:- start:678 stop:926 length:249 start_codon:yes stop_codon:yes gene_type:complete
MGGGLIKPNAHAHPLSDQQVVTDTPQQVTYPYIWLNTNETGYDGDVDEQEEGQEEDEVLHGASQSFQQQGEVFAAKRNSPVP